MILKMTSEERKQKDWVEHLSTVAFAFQTSKHSSTNYEPLLLLIGRKPKLPAECIDLPVDTYEHPDVTPEEMEMLCTGITAENFHMLANMRDKVFNQTN